MKYINLSDGIVGFFQLITLLYLKNVMIKQKSRSVLRYFEDHETNEKIHL